MAAPSIPDRLKSRKFWITILAGFVVLFARELGFELTDAQLWEFVAIVAAYLGGQGLHDAAKNFRTIEEAKPIAVEPVLLRSEDGEG